LPHTFRDDVTLVLYGDVRDSASTEKLIRDLSWLRPRGPLCGTLV
jgi:hypothetical protein